jgi:hypothetical protein
MTLLVAAMRELWNALKDAGPVEIAKEAVFFLVLLIGVLVSLILFG